MRYTRLLLSSLAGALVVGGCAGGGGGGGSSPSVSQPVSPPASPPPPPPPPPPTYPSATSQEYLSNWGLGGVHAITAWQDGATGAGVTVAVIDTGVDGAASALAGRVSPASEDINTARNTLFDPRETHGSEVASVIAANFNGGPTVGTAFNATILAVRADDTSGSDTFALSDLTAAVNYAVAQKVSIINLSVGGSAGSPQFANALSAATAAGIIVVASAGNEGVTGPATQVDYPAFYASMPSISHNLIIAAGGEDQDGTFNSNSNPAGAAQSFYLVAPGWQIIVPQFGPAASGFEVCFANATCQVQGTSFAAPAISGALALLKEAFPGMSAPQLVQLLLTTADPIGGAASPNAVTGFGVIDLARAFAPVGAVRAPLPGQAGSLALGQEVGVVGPAFGDAFAGAQKWAVIGFDSFGRSFSMSLASSWRAPAREDIDLEAPMLWRSAATAFGSIDFAEAPAAPPVSALIEADANFDQRVPFRAETNLGDGLSVAFASGAPATVRANPASAQSAYVALTGDGLGEAVTKRFRRGFDVGLEFEHGLAPNPVGPQVIVRNAQSARLGWTSGSVSGGVRVGGLEEAGDALGLEWAQRWGPSPRAHTRFAGLDAQWRLGPSVRVGAQAELGATRVSGVSWFNQASPILTSAGGAALAWDVRPVALAVLAPQTNGTLTFSVSQPMRVEAGAFSALLPTSDAYGLAHLAFKERAVSAVPTGREVQTRVEYALHAPDALTAHMSFMLATDPGHDASARPAPSVEIGLRKTF